MGDKYRITAGFHVFVPARDGEGNAITRKVPGMVPGEGGAMVPGMVDHPVETKVAFAAGQTVDASEFPEGHTPEEWVAKGLAMSAQAD